ncbi:heavy metal sensor histidine kinase [Achromobacter sp. UMC46]|uniref:heavy metal sensor histidine kinase n=1 Tax=Achromobacter sp. UMC46 TaxID=1862319 RepID=UPI0015FFCC7C|nr:heavy metal sensor histidine kinase [Achromobacter sp. UMC46]MBB1593117.1 two-component sensor histidine kinase [Achromobacter sp. UMC46]
MPAARRPRSLRRWLSRWLAIQTFIALGLVCIAVYYATNLNLGIRQDALLQQKVEVIRHLVEENRGNGDSTRLRHKLDDFFYGRPDFSLELEIDGEKVTYGGPVSGDHVASHDRRITFSLPHPSTPGDSMSAELVLDITPDIRLRRALAWTLFGCALVGAIVAAKVATMLVRRGLAPLDALATQAAQLSPDRIGERLDGSGQADEVRPLVHQFNAVLQRLERAYVQMEGFNADVAHEMRTPLATLIGETELALKTRPSQNALREILGSNLEELHRLSSIVNDMLFLSQADRGAQARATWEGELAEVAGEVAQYHEAEALEQNLHIRVVGTGTAAIDRRLLQRAVSNLVSNAVRYADPGSVIDIILSPSGEDAVQVAVRNTGEPIPAEHLPRLFHRFYRTDEARGFDGNHHGLGLAIVAAIARMHGGTSFARSEGRSTIIGFSVLKPHASGFARDITEN